MSAKQSIKHQLLTIHVVAVAWEPHSSSTKTCTGNVNHELPVNLSKGHTYTNRRPGHYLTHAHSHITRTVADIYSCFALTGAHQHGIAVGQRPGIIVCKRPFPAEARPLSARLPAPHNTCGSCWLGTERQFSHDMRGEGWSWVWCMCAPCLFCILKIVN